MNRLEGQVAVVTGGSRGIGEAVAVRLASEGADVALCASRSAEAAERVAGQVRELGRRALVAQVDVADAASVDAFITSVVSGFGRLDVLVNNAGVTRDGLLLRMEDDAWDRVIDVNLKGSFLMSKHAAGHMQKAGKGVIVLTASGAGVTGGSSSFAYGSSKGGVHGLAMVMAAALGPRGIRVNDVAPGALATPLKIGQVEESYRRTGDRAAYEAAMRSLLPPEGVASVMAFLASDDADYVRGTVFTK
jgi:3-oxoacyl-[acyl-carrier protein] reductase